MDFTKLRSFNKAYPLFVEKYELFSLGENASITDKINSVVQALNKVGKLSNDVLKDWNKVMEWAMGEGLNESVDKKVEELIANGLFDELIQLALTDFNSQVESLETSLAQKMTKGELFLNVKDYGAKGDGTTDDTSAIQSAINSFTSGGTVFFPSGTYIVSNLVLPSKITLQGLNELTSILKHKSSASTHMITLATQKNYKVRLTNLNLQGVSNLPYDLVNWVNDGLGAADSFVDHYHQIDNCTISGTGRHGVYIQGSRENVFDNLKINNCNGNGFYYSNAHDSKISTITVSYCTIGFRFDNVGTVKCHSLKAFGCTSDGLQLSGSCSQDSFTNCELQDNNGHGLSIISGQRIMIKNLMLDTNSRGVTSSNEIYLDNCIDIRIEGYLRQQVTTSINTFIQFVNGVRDYQIDLLHLTAQNQKITFLNANNLVDASTNVRINGREIYNNNIVNPNIMTSITNGIIDGFTLEQDSTAGITYTNKFDGTSQQLNITANTGTGTRFIGIKFTVDVTKISKLGFTCAFEGGNVLAEDYYRIRTESYQAGYAPSIDTQLITTHTGDQTLVFATMSVPSAAATVDVYFEIGVKHNLNRNYKIKNPRIMVGAIR